MHYKAGVGSYRVFAISASDRNIPAEFTARKAFDFWQGFFLCFMLFCVISNLIAPLIGHGDQITILVVNVFHIEIVLVVIVVVWMRV